MRKIFAFIAVSVDGYHAGPNQELDWQNLDEEFDAFSMEQLAEVDTLLFGRVTYEGIVAYWPTQQGSDYHTGIADTMNSIDKIVVSRTLKTADWTNTRLITTNVQDELTALKRRPGKDIAIFGSSTLTAGHEIAAVTADGNVRPCVMSRWMSAGSVKDLPLAAFVTGVIERV